jgi:hypothetical protein
MPIYVRDVLGRELKSLTEEEHRKLSEDFEEIYQSYLMRGGRKFNCPVGIAVNF